MICTLCERIVYCIIILAPLNRHVPYKKGSSRTATMEIQRPYRTVYGVPHSLRIRALCAYDIRSYTAIAGLGRVASEWWRFKIEITVDKNIRGAECKLICDISDV